MPLTPDARVFPALLDAYEEDPSNLLIEGLSERANSVLNRAITSKNAFLILDSNRDTQEQIFELALHRGLKWRNGRTLKVAFIGGSPALNSLVAKFASDWTKYANLNFEFVEEGPSDIRVAFEAGKGHWSHIGTNCSNIPQNEPTMNFDDIALSPYHDIRRVVLHEFGHALGCVHEHQSPAAGIPWDRPAVYKDYLNKQGWSPKMVDDNVLNKYGSSVPITNSRYDADSIMRYPIDSIHVTNISFAKDWNDDLSAGDKAFIAKEYPGR